MIRVTVPPCGACHDMQIISENTPALAGVFFFARASPVRPSDAEITPAAEALNVARKLLSRAAEAALTSDRIAQFLRLFKLQRQV